MFQLLKIGACLRGFFAVRVTKQKILERSSRVVRRRQILGATPRGREPNVTHLILRVRRYRIIRKFIYHCRVGLESGVIGSLFLTRQANVELRTRGVLSVGRSPNYGRKNFDRAIH